jgi:hypothetical protein
VTDPKSPIVDPRADTVNGEGRYEYRIVDVCEALHMAGNGSSDPLPPEQRRALIKKLMARLQDWGPSPKFSRRYDDAIRDLIWATIQECVNADR